MPEQLAIEAKGVWKGYGGRPVLRGLDLQVRWGEVVVLLGANGSGKTTLLKLLATLGYPDRGELQVAGLSTRRDGARVRSILGVVTHQPLVYDAMSVRENLRFYGRMYGLSDIAKRVGEVVERVGLTPRIDQRAGTLSHGAQKRLAIARSLLHDPPLLLLDEPESGLDPEAVAGLGAMLQSEGERRRTVVMTTHNMQQAAALADRVLVISQGRIAHHEDRATLKGSGSAEARLRDVMAHYLEATP